MVAARVFAASIARYTELGGQRRMRVLQVTHNFLPYSIGGIETHVYGLSQQLSQSCAVRVFFRAPLSRGSGLTERTEYNGLHCVAFEKSYHAKDATRQVEAAFSTLLDDFQPDVVHFHHLRRLSPKLPGIASASGAAVVFTLHDLWLICPRFFMVTDAWEPCDGPGELKCRLCLSRIPKFYETGSLTLSQPRTWTSILTKATRLSPRLVVNSLRMPSLAQRLSQTREDLSAVDLFTTAARHLIEWHVNVLGIREARFVQSDYGIDHSNLEDMQHSSGGRIRFGFVGSIDYHKGVHVLLEAFETIRDADLLLFGNVRDCFAPYLARHGQSNVRLMGAPPYERKREMFEPIDVLVLPSVCREGASLVTREAFIAGIPVIGSNVGGIAELVQHGKNGLLFRPGDVNDLRAQLRTIIEHPELVDTLRRGISRLKSCKEDAADILALYQGLLRERRGTPLSA